MSSMNDTGMSALSVNNGFQSLKYNNMHMLHPAEQTKVGLAYLYSKSLSLLVASTSAVTTEIGTYTKEDTGMMFQRSIYWLFSLYWRSRNSCNAEKAAGTPTSYMMRSAQANLEWSAKPVTLVQASCLLPNNLRLENLDGMPKLI